MGVLGAFAVHSSHAQGFELSSADIAPGSTIEQTHAFNGFGCAEQNTSPAIDWRNPPAGTKSFAVMVQDPDAPTRGAGFWHWVVVDIPATAASPPHGVDTSEGSGLPGGARQIATDFGTPGWGGPCPSVGDKPHRYVFTVYALKVDRLKLPDNATASLAGFVVNANALGYTSFTALYGLWALRLLNIGIETMNLQLKGQLGFTSVTPSTYQQAEQRIEPALPSCGTASPNPASTAVLVLG